MPNFHQHIYCPTRGLNTLDHCYTPLKNAYKAHSLPAFGKSDHAAIFLTPEYIQRIVQEPPVEREVTRWSSHSEAMLQASLDDDDWDMFRASLSDVSEFKDVALSFVNTLKEQATETVIIRTLSNQKPWVDRKIRDAVVREPSLLRGIAVLRRSGSRKKQRDEEGRGTRRGGTRRGGCHPRGSGGVGAVRQWAGACCHPPGWWRSRERGTRFRLPSTGGAIAIRQEAEEHRAVHQSGPVPSHGTASEPLSWLRTERQCVWEPDRDFYLFFIFLHSRHFNNKINEHKWKAAAPHGRLPHRKHKLKFQAWSSLVFHCCHSSFNPSEAPPWDSRPVSGAGVVHYQLLHRPRSVPTALGPAPLVKAVNHRTAAYNTGILSGNMSEYKASCYTLRRAIRAAKRRYREIIESHFQLNDSRRMWQGLKTICSSGNNSSAEVRADPLLAEELNTFYGRFECNGAGATLPSSASGSSRQSRDHVFTLSEDKVWRELRRVNVRKAAGPDGITGRVLRSCADQLAGLFTSIFNESLATSVVPTSFK